MKNHYKEQSNQEQNKKKNVGIHSLSIVANMLLQEKLAHRASLSEVSTRMRGKFQLHQNYSFGIS